MDQKDDKELLCFEGGGKTYAVEFANVVEICFNTKLHRIPCQPAHFCGVYHYKGMVVPAVQIGEEETQNGRSPVLLMLRSGVYLFGISLQAEPFIQTVEECEKTVDFAKNFTDNKWKEQAIYVKGDKMILLLDMEKTTENLVAYS